MVHRKIALLAGGCIAALAVPSKVSATIYPGIVSGGMNPAVPVELVVTKPGNSATFGDVEVGDYIVSSLVETSNQGVILQWAIAQNAVPGTADISVLNQGSAWSGSTASANNLIFSTEANSDLVAVSQHAEASKAATINFTNDGDWTAIASAEAVSVAGATAHANLEIAFDQSATLSPFARLDIQNNGRIWVDSLATATGSLPLAQARLGNALQQYSKVGDIALNIANNGSMSINVHAKAYNASASTAIAKVLPGAGISQLSEGATGQISPGVPTQILFANFGDFTLDLGAEAALGITLASALAEAELVYGIGQTMKSEWHSLDRIANHGNVAIRLASNAVEAGPGPTGTVASLKSGGGLYQNTVSKGSGNANDEILNNGTFHYDLKSTAEGDAVSALVDPTFGALQLSNGSINGTTFTNHGQFDVTASTTANSNVLLGISNNATSIAEVGGVRQWLNGEAMTATIVNDGNIFVGSTAEAISVDTALAEATTTGIDQLFDNADPAVSAHSIASFNNSGQITVKADATASAPKAEAHSKLTGYAAGPFLFSYSMDVQYYNSGSLQVEARATAETKAEASAVGVNINGELNYIFGGSIINDGLISATAMAWSPGGGKADATAVLIESLENELFLINNGTIEAKASLAFTGSGSGSATAIKVLSDLVFPTKYFTLTNSGDIKASLVERATAIDLADGPKLALIVLKTGSITGDIKIKDGNEIFSTTGATKFDGIVNPGCAPLLDSPGSLCRRGLLRIDDLGTFILRNDISDPYYFAPSYAFVSQLEVGKGDVRFDLTISSSGGKQDVGTYPQIFTETALLEETSKLSVKPVITGLLQTSYLFENVIDADLLVGTFGSCGFSSPSAVLQLTCEYDNAFNVDLKIEKIAMNAVPGLDDNAQSLGAALESAYGGTGQAMPGVIASLLTMDAKAYGRALGQLSGSGYADYLASIGSLGLRFNEMIDDAGTGPAVTVAGLRYWGGQSARSSGGAENRMTMRGVEADLGGRGRAGFTFGRSASQMDGGGDGRASAEGAQFGAYGQVNAGDASLKAMAGYSRYDGRLDRSVNFSPFGGTLQGKADVSLVTLGLHGAAPVARGLKARLDLDLSKSRLEGLSEAGLGEAGLDIKGGSQTRIATTAGLNWTGSIAGLRSSASLGYRHEFADRAASFRASLADGPLFTIRSDEKARGSLLAGLSLEGRLGPVDLRLNYDGELNGGRVSQQGGLSLSLPF